VNDYNCRESNGSLKVLHPGESRRELFCPGCVYLSANGCLFPKRTGTPIATPKPRLYHRTAERKYSDPDMVNTIKQVWRDIGRPPEIKDLNAADTHPRANHISKRYPGGFRAAREEARRQLQEEEQ